MTRCGAHCLEPWPQVALALTSMDREQLRYRASEASQTLALCKGEAVDPRRP